MLPESMDLGGAKLVLGCPVCGEVDMRPMLERLSHHPSPRMSYVILECCACKHWATSPTPQKELLDALYAEGSLSITGAHLDYWSLSDQESRQAERYAWVLEKVEELSPRSVLEVGSGRGWLLSALRARGIEAWGIDPGSWARSEHSVSSISELPQEHDFDFLVAIDVLEHVASPAGLLSEVVQRATPGATVVVKVPYSQSLEALWAPELWPMLAPPTHLHYFSRESLATLLDSTGLSVMEMKTQRVWPRRQAARVATLRPFAYLWKHFNATGRRGSLGFTRFVRADLAGFFSRGDQLICIAELASRD